VNPYELLENQQSGEARYVVAGDGIGGLRVAGFDRHEIRLEANGTWRQIAMNDDFDLVPLDRDAAYLGGRVTPHDHGASKTAEEDMRQPSSLG
jgi:hypothetical protein